MLWLEQYARSPGWENCGHLNGYDGRRLPTSAEPVGSLNAEATRHAWESGPPEVRAMWAAHAAPGLSTLERSDLLKSVLGDIAHLEFTGLAERLGGEPDPDDIQLDRETAWDPADWDAVLTCLYLLAGARTAPGGREATVHAARAVARLMVEHPQTGELLRGETPLQRWLAGPSAKNPDQRPDAEWLRNTKPRAVLLDDAGEDGSAASVPLTVLGLILEHGERAALLADAWDPAGPRVYQRPWETDTESVVQLARRWRELAGIS